MSADQYEIVFSFAVLGRSSPVGRIGAAAPIALTGAIKMCCVAIPIIAPADSAFVLMQMYLEIASHGVSLASFPKPNEEKIIRRAWGAFLRKQSTKSPPRTISSK